MLRLIVLVSLLFSFVAWGEDKPYIAVLYTASGMEGLDLSEDLGKIAEFALSHYDSENHTKTNVKVVGIDDGDDPKVALAALEKLSATSKPLAIIGPVYSQVAMGLKDFVNSKQIPLISVFATHNDLTKGSSYVFRICASNKRLVKTMTDFVVPEATKNHLSITAFKDLSDAYSIDLADSFRKNMQGTKVTYEEVDFKDAPGLERLQDINSKIWTPKKTEIIFLPLRDTLQGRVIAALETEPYLVASIDPVNFLTFTRRLKKQKTHIRLISTSQWQPGKSDYSKKVEFDYQKQFRKGMTATAALAYDAVITFASAYHRSQTNGLPLNKVLRDGTRLNGLTGLINFGPDGERVISDQFFKEDFIE